MMFMKYNVIKLMLLLSVTSSSSRSNGVFPLRITIAMWIEFKTEIIEPVNTGYFCASSGVVFFVLLIIKMYGCVYMARSNFPWTTVLCFENQDKIKLSFTSAF